jgi:mediator of RNA polymerase II transcription subunit 7
MDEEEAELRNPFPSPPSHYTNYTSHNLELLRLLRERAGDDDLSQINQHEVLSDQTDVPDFPLVQLERPRVDWILEEGHYTVFGDTWFVREFIRYTLRVDLRVIAGERDNTISRRAWRPPAVPH